MLLVVSGHFGLKVRLVFLVIRVCFDQANVNPIENLTDVN